jgi:hypothetical protein
MENELSAGAEFASRFATEAACRDYLIQLRWPDGFRCPQPAFKQSELVFWDQDERFEGQVNPVRAYEFHAHVNLLFRGQYWLGHGPMIPRFGESCNSFHHICLIVRGFTPSRLCQLKHLPYRPQRFVLGLC